MSIFFFNCFLLLGFVVATVPDIRFVQGSPDPAETMEPIVKKCRYHRNYALLEARCNALELAEIPTTLKTDIQVRFR